MNKQKTNYYVLNMNNNLTRNDYYNIMKIMMKSYLQNG